MPKTTGIVLDVAGQRGGAMPGVTTLYDRSRWANNGAFGAGAAAPTWAQLPTSVWVLDFDGGDYIDLGTGVSLDCVPAATFLAWINPTALVADSILFSKASWEVAGTQYWLTTDGSLGLYTHQVGAHQQTLSGVGTITTGAWFHIAIVRDGATCRMYRDGVDLGVVSAAHINPLPSSEHGYLGQTNAGTNRYNGKLSGRLYLFALSAAQVRARFQATRGLFGV